MALNRTFVMVAVAALFGLSAPPPAPAQDSLLKTIKDRGVLRVCDVEYPPWNVKNPGTNRWEGANIDIINLVADMLKVKVEHVDATWATVIPNMTTQKCDFSGAGLYISPPRAELVTFTRPFAQDGISVFVPASSTARTVEEVDKAGKTIVVRSGSVEESVAKRLFKHATVKTLTTDGAGIMLLEIAAGRADAGAGGYFGNLIFLKGNPNLKVRVLSDTLLTRTPIAYAVPPREYFLRDYLNAVLLTLEENGKIQEILAKWTR